MIFICWTCSRSSCLKQPRRDSIYCCGFSHIKWSEYLFNKIYIYQFNSKGFSSGLMFGGIKHWEGIILLARTLLILANNVCIVMSNPLLSLIIIPLSAFIFWIISLNCFGFYFLNYTPISPLVSTNFLRVFQRPFASYLFSLIWWSSKYFILSALSKLFARFLSCLALLKSSTFWLLCVFAHELVPVNTEWPYIFITIRR